MSIVYGSVDPTALAGWISPNLARQDWPDAPEDDQELVRYLYAAHEQCLAFLPHVRNALTCVLEPVVPSPVPDRFRLAQRLQARALYRSAVAGSGDAIGPDGMAVTVFPMDWTVKNLLRPKRVGRVL